MKKIDAHNHPYFWGRTFERMIEDMDANGIEKTCLFSWEAPEDDVDPETRFSNGRPLDAVTGPVPFSWCWEFKQKAPDRFILGYAPDPRDPNAVMKMRSALMHFDVQMCAEVKLRMMYDNPDAIELFRFCGENGLPVTLHMDNAAAQLSHQQFPRRSWWYGGDIDTVERVLKLCPETNFLGHAPGFWCHISNDEKGMTEAYPTGPVIPGGRIEQLLEKFPNLYCDCSAGSAATALGRDPAYTKKLIETFPTRFIFARDMFNSVLAEFIDTLGLSEELLENFYHKNIERLLPPTQNAPVM